MKKLNKKIVIAMCLAFASLTTHADDNSNNATQATTTAVSKQAPSSAPAEWELALEKKDIKVYTQFIPGSELKAFRGEMLLENTNLTQVEAFLKEIENTPKWLDRCDEATLVEQLSDEAVVLYVSLKMPWPVKDRDVVGLSELSFSEDRKTMYTSIKKIERADHPPVKGRVRADEMRSKLSFTEIDEGRISVLMEGHAEPGGSIPSWLANLLVTESPYKSLMNLRTLIPKTDTSLAQQ